MNCLIVDDNEDLSKILAEILEMLNVSNEVINDGREALEAIKNNDYDLILLDLGMPEFSGMDIIHELNNSNIIQSKNIVLCTANSLDSKEEEDFENLGVKGFLPKPYAINNVKIICQKFIK